MVWQRVGRLWKYRINSNHGISLTQAGLTGKHVFHEFTTFSYSDGTGSVECVRNVSDMIHEQHQIYQVPKLSSTYSHAQQQDRFWHGWASKHLVASAATYTSRRAGVGKMNQLEI